MSNECTIIMMMYVDSSAQRDPCLGARRCDGGRNCYHLGDECDGRRSCEDGSDEDGIECCKWFKHNMIDGPRPILIKLSLSLSY